MTDFPFLTDILSQPKGLEDVANGFDPAALAALQKRLAGGEFDRVVITGMGASTFATYPAWLLLAQAGLPAYWVDTSELLAFTPGLLTPRTLLWVVSNSGKSIEIIRLLKRVEELGYPYLLAHTNTMDSPLAAQAGLALPLFTGPDLTLATRSYMGVLAVTQLTALTLLGQSVAQELDDLRYTAAGLREYLDDWQAHLQKLDEMVGRLNRVTIVGRGPSFASAMESALCFKEGPKLNGEGMTLGQFWHGPIELADESLTAFFMAGTPTTRAEDEALAARTASLGAKVLWLSAQPSTQLPSVELPKYRGIGLTAAEIVPVQLVAINCGQQTGFRPGDFRHINKTMSTKVDIFSDQR